MSLSPNQRRFVGPMAMGALVISGSLLGGFWLRWTDSSLSQVAETETPIIAGPLFTIQSSEAPGEKARIDSVIQTPEQLSSRPLFYCTTRSETNFSHVTETTESSIDPSPSTANWGMLQITVPLNHHAGQLELPRTRLTAIDPERHFAIVDHQQVSEQSWLDELQREIEAIGASELLVFVHGMNTSFDEALLRLSQFRHDTQFDGPVIAFAWPSQGSFSFDGYHMDEAAAMASVPQFTMLLEQLAQRFPSVRRHVLAHSLGCRIVMTSALPLARVAESEESLIEELILAAPDIDHHVFETLGRSALDAISRRITIYATPNDLALRLSSEQHGERQRVGLCPVAIESHHAMDVIDVTEMLTPLNAVRLNHLYVLDNRVVLEHVSRRFNASEDPSPMEMEMAMAELP